MGICDICGKARDTRVSNIEGAEMEACFSCVPGQKERPKYAGKGRSSSNFKKRSDLPKVNFEFIDDFGIVIKTAREKAEITQKDFGVMINEHSSIIQKMEHGEFKPRLGLAKKIEKKLRIRIIKKIEQLDKDGNVVNNKKTEGSESRDSNSKGRFSRDNGRPRVSQQVYTLADAIKIKKSK